MAVDENFNFIYPPTNVPAHTIGPVNLYDTIELSWTPSTLYIAPPYRLQMACLLANNTYIFEPITNISSPHLYFFKENYDTQPYGCWWGFMVPTGGNGETGAAFNVVPTTAATAITFRASATPSSSSSSTSSTSPSSSSATPTSSSSSQTTSTSTTPAAASDTAAAAPANTGLSTGAKAGIGVGVAAGAILLLALVLGMLFLRKRQKQKRAKQELLGPDVTKLRHDGPPLAFVEAEAPYPYAEADAGDSRHEMQA